MAKWLFVVLLSVVALFSPFVGAASLQWEELLSPGSLSHQIMVELRLPRLLLAFCAGATLALAGLLFQTLFRNVLMTPYTLGVSGGAVLGAGVAIKLGLGALFGIASVTLFGFTGALLTVGLLLWLSRYLKRAEYESLLLLGIALSFFYTSALMVLFYLSDFVETHMLMRFTLGSLATVGYEQVFITALAALGLVMAIWLRRFELQLLAVSEEQARLKGLNTARLTYALLAVASLAVGALVSLTGPIGFVGLVVPHIVRRLYAVNVKGLIWPVFWLGGLFLVSCDTAARLAGSGSEIPIGVVTSLIGGPFFVYLIIRGRTQ